MHKKLKYSSPSVGLFFRKQTDETQYIEANVYGIYGSGDYSHRYISLYQSSLPGDSVLSLTNDKSWHLTANIMCSKTLENLIAALGIKEYYNSIDNKQIENGILDKGKITQDRLSMYGQLQGRIKRLGYSLSAISIYSCANNNSYGTDAVRLKSNIVANYSLP